MGVFVGTLVALNRCFATTIAIASPTSCATINSGASIGRMPANDSVAARASVTAGFANDVDAVNQ
jgi:hypothetical protein